MKRLYKTLAVTCVIVGALTAVAAASASAASFEASETGPIKGHALSGSAGKQIFTTNAGTVECTSASTTGNVTELSAESQVVTVNYGGCTAFTIASVEISPAEYRLHAGGSVDILNTITITVHPPLLKACTVTVGPQTGLGSVSYENTSPVKNIIEKSAVEGIKYKGSSGVCGNTEEHANGTYTGGNEVELVNGGTLRFVP